MFFLFLLAEDLQKNDNFMKEIDRISYGFPGVVRKFTCDVAYCLTVTRKTEDNDALSLRINSS